MNTETLILLINVFLLNVILTIIFERKYKLINIFDEPKAKIKDHKQKIPVCGGILFLLIFLYLRFWIYSILTFFLFNRFSILLIFL